MKSHKTTKLHGNEIEKLTTKNVKKTTQTEMASFVQQSMMGCTAVSSSSSGSWHSLLNATSCSRLAAQTASSIMVCTSHGYRHCLSHYSTSSHSQSLCFRPFTNFKLCYTNPSQNTYRKMFKMVIAFMETHLKSYNSPYEITQCYMPRDTTHK